MQGLGQNPLYWGPCADIINGSLGAGRGLGTQNLSVGTQATLPRALPRRTVSRGTGSPKATSPRLPPPCTLCGPLSSSCLQGLPAWETDGTGRAGSRQQGALQAQEVGTGHPHVPFCASWVLSLTFGTPWTPWCASLCIPGPLAVALRAPQVPGLHFGKKKLCSPKIWFQVRYSLWQ